MTDKIKLEDMTLREIEELRDEMERKIRKAIFAVESEYENKYYLGQICVNTHTSTSNIEENPYLYVNVSFYKDAGEWQV